MLKRYATVLATPGAMGFFIPGFLIRLPMAATGISILMAYTELHGRYGIAGLLSGIYAVASAIAAPIIARWADRHGQHRVLPISLTLHLVMLAGLTGLLYLDAPLAALIPMTAATGGTYGSMGSMVRARWSYVVDQHSLRHHAHVAAEPTTAAANAGQAGQNSQAGQVVDSGQPVTGPAARQAAVAQPDATPPDPKKTLETAFALESVLDELVFITGPIAAVALATSVHPIAGLLASWLSLALGMVFFFRATSSNPPATPTGRSTGNVFQFTAVAPLVATLVGVGLVFGTLEISTVAALEAVGRKSAAGLTLACFALGSLLSGLWYGSRQWHSPNHWRMAVGLVLLTIALMILPLVAYHPVLPVAALAVGVCISPCLVSGVSLMKELVPASHITEAMAWISTAIAIGVAGGMAAVGFVSEHYGAIAGFWCMVTAGGVAALVAWASQPAFTRALKG